MVARICRYPKIIRGAYIAIFQSTLSRTSDINAINTGIAKNPLTRSGIIFHESEVKLKIITRAINSMSNKGAATNSNNRMG